jgi:hypothetical protein
MTFKISCKAKLLSRLSVDDLQNLLQSPNEESILESFITGDVTGAYGHKSATKQPSSLREFCVASAKGNTTAVIEINSNTT